SEATWRELTSLVTPIPVTDPPPELGPLAVGFNGYGLGLGVRDYRGHKTLAHTGGLPGYLSPVVWIPDANVGVAVLTNQESGAGFDSIAFHVLDHYLDAPPFDWIAAMARVRQRTETENAARARRADAARDASSKPSLAQGKYAGTFRDAW